MVDNTAVTPTLRAVYEELIERASRPPYDRLSNHHRQRFVARCGAFAGDHPGAESRDAASWEDVLVRGGLARIIIPELDDPSERDAAAALITPHRGVYEFRRVGSDTVATDEWSGAAFVITPSDDFARSLVELDSLCQARLAPDDGGCAVLPGTVYHSAEVRSAVSEVLKVAHERCCPTDIVMDSLLKMEHVWHSHSRVKPRYAYRADRLLTTASDNG